MSNDYNISAGFLSAAKAHGDRLFYSDAARDLTYGDMESLVRRLATCFRASRKSGRVGILATRSVEAYAGILASGMAGMTYVPLNLKWPEERLVALIRTLDLDAIVVDAKAMDLLTPSVLDVLPGLVVLADSADKPDARPGQEIVRLESIDAAPMAEPAPVGSDDLAYVLFTSGTTGMPKGVMVPAGALASYVDEARKWTNFVPDDRLAETFDVTFDLSVHNLMLCAEAGASQHLLSPLEMLAPGRAIRSRELTVWFSVPTLAAMMRSKGSLKPGVFPSLRLSQFCGEPLPASVALDWAAAAPNSVIENVYGPTEFTITCTRQRLTDPPLLTESRNILAIGEPFANTLVAVFDSSQHEVPDGNPGEIALSGPQIAAGYLDAPEKTADRFRLIDGRRWYLTGDLGMRDADGVLHHLGRIDNQIKLKGNRIELEEVEMHLRQAAGSDAAAVVAWPMIDGSAQGLVAFCVSSKSAGAIRDAMLRSLPRYMVPERMEFLDVLPVGSTGKTDRRALAAMLEASNDSGPPAIARMTAGASR